MTYKQWTIEEFLDKMKEVRWNGSKLRKGITVSFDLDAEEFPELKKIKSLPQGLRVEGALYLRGCKLESLPRNLIVEGRLCSCKSLKKIGKGLRVGEDLDLTGCEELVSLPKGIRVHENMTLSGCKALKTFSHIQVGGDLEIMNCPNLVSIGENVRIGGDLDLRRVKSLKEIGNGVDVKGDLYCPSSLERIGSHVYVEGEMLLLDCVKLESFPRNLDVGSLTIQGCHGLSSLNPSLNTSGIMEIINCPNLKLPKGLKIGGDFEFDEFLEGFDGVKFKGAVSYRGVDLDKALLKKTLSLDEFRKLDSEQQRVAIIRFGVEWLVKKTKPELVDVDSHNINGHRALLRVQIERLSDWSNTLRSNSQYCILVCGDPSTGRVYYMEVPPKTKTCQEADQYLNRGLDQRRQVGRT